MCRRRTMESFGVYESARGNFSALEELSRAPTLSIVFFRHSPKCSSDILILLLRHSSYSSDTLIRSHTLLRAPTILSPYSSNTVMHCHALTCSCNILILHLRHPCYSSDTLIHSSTLHNVPSTLSVLFL